MSISSCVHHLAIALRRDVDDPVLGAYVDKLAEMPRYVADRRLDLWDEALGAQRPVGDDPLHTAAAAICELGRFNMYGAIEDEKTRKLYTAALAALASAEIVVPPAEHDLGDW